MSEKLRIYPLYPYKLISALNASEEFAIIEFQDKSKSFFPRNLLVNYLNQPASLGVCVMGRSVFIGHGSTIRMDSTKAKITLQNYISMGKDIRIISYGRHNFDIMSQSNLNIYHDIGINVPQAQGSSQITIGNDVFIGDNTTILSGVNIGDGCVIGAGSLIPQDKKLDPYGVYVGNPARKAKLRFNEKIVEALLELKWWDNSLDWVIRNNDKFNANLNDDISKSLDIIKQLKETSKNKDKAKKRELEHF